MISRETHRFVIREDDRSLDALWIKKFSVKSTDVDATDWTSERLGDEYQSRLDVRKTR